MNDAVVVDAVLALKWVLDEPDSVAAVKLLNSWTDRGTKVIAPALLTYEVAKWSKKTNNQKIDLCT